MFVDTARSARMETHSADLEPSHKFSFRDFSVVAHTVRFVTVVRQLPRIAVPDPENVVRNSRSCQQNRVGVRKGHSIDIGCFPRKHPLQGLQVFRT